MPSSAAVPTHLRRYVVEQDYAEYTEVDQAVWRFVMLQARARLRDSAHPAYLSGLSATGISVERIPRIDEMNEKLSRFGWGAVCVDGFIPPRAFQDFQANRILPIAAEIRSVEHLAYTPAPDILHEAAGHAPILSEPAYAHFIQAFGKTASKAFALPADRAVYQAIYALSELKEHPLSTPAQIEAGMQALKLALGAVTEVSESARLARLYWWTAEYGLVGTPDDYRLYGAGLLSSLGESHSCRAESVRKLPLSVGCSEVDYDITRAQPQLFVARDFEQPLRVLEELSSTLAQRVGGLPGLELAKRSEELASLELDTGLSVIGNVTSYRCLHGEPCLVQLSGAPALAEGERLLPEHCPADYVLPLGALADGRPLASLARSELPALTDADTLRLALASGITISGSVRGVRARGEQLQLLLLERCELRLPDGQTFRAQAPYPLLLGTKLCSVSAGATAAYFGASEPSRTRVPRARWLSAQQHELLGLYERAVAAVRGLRGTAQADALARLADELQRSAPTDWLLRWNLLESLLKLNGDAQLIARLTAELEALERHYRHEAPIASGLTYLRTRTSDGASDESH